MLVFQKAEPYFRRQVHMTPIQWVLWMISLGYDPSGIMMPSDIDPSGPPKGGTTGSGG
jgi:hypothetical protein